MMSEKIMITVEQNERIESFVSFAQKQEMLERHIKGWIDAKNDCLNKLSTDQMARILYEPNSYEVEQTKYQIGDWATRINADTREPNRKPGRTFKVCGKRYGVVTDSDLVDHHEKYIRHATKEEIFWAELGRGLNEVHEGDVIRSVYDSVFTVDDEQSELDDFISVKAAMYKFACGNVKGFYPASTYIKLP